MSRFTQIAAIGDAPADSRPLLEAIAPALDYAPRLFMTLANSPVALEALIGMSSALGKGSIATATRERIGIAVSSLNGAEYSRVVYEAAARSQGLSEDEIAANREGRSLDLKADPAVRFAYRVAGNGCRVSDGEIEACRAAGYSDAQLIELVAQASLTNFSNCLNNLFEDSSD